MYQAKETRYEKMEYHPVKRGGIVSETAVLAAAAAGILRETYLIYSFQTVSYY